MSRKMKVKNYVSSKNSDFITDNNIIFAAIFHVKIQ